METAEAEIVKEAQANESLLFLQHAIESGEAHRRITGKLNELDLLDLIENCMIYSDTATTKEFYEVLKTITARHYTEFCELVTELNNL